MPPFRDLTGQIFARLTVLHRAEHARRVAWVCRCECGNMATITGDQLTGLQTKSCGCWRSEQARARREKPKPQPGDRHGRLTVLEFIGTDSKHPTIRCQCDCGVIVTVQMGNVRSGATKSCGCLRTEGLRARSTTHGMSYTPEFKAWWGMRERCMNTSRPDFQRYGAKGIIVCPRWLESFDNFFADMGRRPSRKHSIDRIDTCGNYEPSNCRWATAKTQRINQRRVTLYTVHGITGTAKDLALHFGANKHTVHDRMWRLGWSIEDALAAGVIVAKHIG